MLKILGNKLSFEKEKKKISLQIYQLKSWSGYMLLQFFQVKILNLLLYNECIPSHWSPSLGKYLERAQKYFPRFIK